MDKITLNGRDYTLVTVDYETYFDADYTLSKKMNVSEYIRDDRFNAYLVGIKIGNGPTKTYAEHEVIPAMQAIDWANCAFVAHNAQFDGLIAMERHGITPPGLWIDTVAMARACLPHVRNHKLDTVAKYFGLAGKEKASALQNMKGVKNYTPEMLAACAEYCVDDVDMTYEIFVQMYGSIPDRELRLIHETTRMFCQPVAEIDVDRVRDELKRELAFKAQALSKVNVPISVLMSNDQFANELKARGVEPPTKISPTTGEETYAFAKGDLEFQALEENPLVADLIAARLAVRSTLAETRAGRFIAAGTTGKLPVALNYYGAHCVPGDTEVLTPNGWQPLEEWQGGVIAQVDEQQQIRFLPATRFVGPTAEEWLEVKAPYVQCDFTLGHTMPYLTHGGMQFAQEKAGDFSKRNSRFVPISGVCTDAGSLTPEQMRAIVMVQADGHIETNTAFGRCITIFVKKERKKQRARELLTACGIPFTTHEFASHPGFLRFVIRQIDAPTWLLKSKTFGAWLLDSTAEAKKAFVEELHLWDGWVHNGSQHYCTTSTENAEWVQTMLHLAGFSGRIITKPPRTESRKPLYVIGIRARNYAQVKASAMEITRKPQQTYCTQTQTGFWLARRNGHIFVTGNTGRWSGGNKMNLQNLPRGSELRRSIVAPPGHKIVVCDSSQIEARVLAWLAGQENLLEQFRNKADVYSAFASVVYGRPIDRKRVDEHGNKPDELEGIVAKVCVLGLGYQMGAPRLQETFATGMMGPKVEFSLEECRHFVNTYRTANIEISRLWQRMDHILRAASVGQEGSYKCLSWGKDYIRLPNGMFLHYPALTVTENDQIEYYNKFGISYIYGGLATENAVQALARIIVAEQMLDIIDADQDYTVMTMTHDEIVVICPDEKADACLDDMLRIMRTPPNWAPDLPLDAEGGYAQDYSK